MATIDKSLPNTKTEFEIPGEEEIVESQQEIIERQQGGEPEITMDEEGGATVEFDPAKVNPEGGQDHFLGLAGSPSCGTAPKPRPEAARLARAPKEKYGTKDKKEPQSWKRVDATRSQLGHNQLDFKWLRAGVFKERLSRIYDLPR